MLAPLPRQELVGQDDETRAMLKGVLGQLAPPAASVPAAAPLGEAKEQPGFDAPQQGAAGAAAAAPGSAPVQVIRQWRSYVHAAD